MVDLGLLMDKGQAMLVASRLGEIIHEHVTDQDALRKIGADFERLFHGPAVGVDAQPRRHLMAPPPG